MSLTPSPAFQVGASTFVSLVSWIVIVRYKTYVYNNVVLLHGDLTMMTRLTSRFAVRHFKHLYLCWSNYNERWVWRDTGSMLMALKL